MKPFDAHSKQLSSHVDFCQRELDRATTKANEAIAASHEALDALTAARKDLRATNHAIITLQGAIRRIEANAALQPEVFWDLGANMRKCEMLCNKQSRITITIDALATLYDTKLRASMVAKDRVIGLRQQHIAAQAAYAAYAAAYCAASDAKAAQKEIAAFERTLNDMKSRLGRLKLPKEAKPKTTEWKQGKHERTYSNPLGTDVHFPPRGRAEKATFSTPVSKAAKHAVKRGSKHRNLAAKVTIYTVVDGVITAKRTELN